MTNSKNYFIMEGKVVSYRMYRGSYQARYRRDGYNIEVSGKTKQIMKVRFLEKLREADGKRFSLFRDAVQEWLSLKKRTVKEVTYQHYQKLMELYLLPKFGNKSVDIITRKEIQEFLFEFFDGGKYRTAQKLKILLSSIYSLLMEDYPSLRSLMTRIILPDYETKKGQAFTIEEERQIVEFCKRNPQYKGNSAILLMLYTGMRVGERKTVTCDEKYIYCQSEKVHKGKPVKTRKIPISPMFREVLLMIHWELAIHTSNFTVRDALKRIFPNRHTHELRYTFITRVKECGINPELVMQWVGHEYYDEVWTSRVNRGYTNYSEEYELKEMEKYRYLESFK